MEIWRCNIAHLARRSRRDIWRLLQDPSAHDLQCWTSRGSGAIALGSAEHRAWWRGSQRV